MRVATKADEAEKRHTLTIGRYLLHRQIARGGMATIHIARLLGDEGFSRIVAAKRLLPELAEDTEFVAMFMDEARIASKVHHPNVVPVLDLVTTNDEVMLVQEYVHGVPLHVLLRTVGERRERIPVRIAVSIAAQVLAGLHAAHTTVDELGTPLHIVHRDVSPQNVMVAVDGSARLLDFGVAKATMAAHVTRENTFKGKLAYSAPEQVRGKPVQQSDVYALAVVLWELLVGHRMHDKSQSEAELLAKVVGGAIPALTDVLSNRADWGAIDPEERKRITAVEPVVAKGLVVDLDRRHATAAEMEHALTKAVPPASSSELAAWVRTLGKDYIDSRDKIIAAEEASWRRTHANVATMPGDRQLVPPQPDVAIEVLPDLAPAAAPVVPSPPAGKLVLAGLSVLVVLLAIGVVWAVKSDVRTVSTLQAPAPDVETTTAETPPAPAAKPAPVTPAVPETESPPVRPDPVEQPRSRSRPRTTSERRSERTQDKGDKRDQPTDEPADTRPAAAEPSKDDCNPPYYFEGTKKVFKPSCL